jgi:tRNA A37 threonylcarbamoyladenosine synthetase subunit TsaC/SUA5/YrdC
MLTDEVDVLIDGGKIAPSREASTVVFASKDDIKILRHGPIGEAELRAALK